MRRTLFWFILCAVLIAFWLFLRPPAAWLDGVYGDRIYPVIASVLVPLSGGVSLPVTALLLAALLLWLALSVALDRRLRGPRAFWRFLWHGLVTAATLYALFIVLWGANYGKTPLETRLGLSTGAPTAAETLELAEDLSRVLRQTLPQTQGTRQDWTADLNAGKVSLQTLVAGLEHHAVTLPRYIKYTPSGFLIFTGGATGITIPWTLEAYVDRALPYPVALATALHESAHVAGYAGEAEADLIAALAGLTAERAGVRYGAALVLFLRVAQALPPERYRALYNDLSAETKLDIAAFSRAYERYGAPDLVALIQRRFYDRYLRTQRVDAGIADYDRVVVLVLAAKRGGLLHFEPGEVLVNPAGLR